MSARTLGLFYAILTGLCWAVLAIGLKYALHYASSANIAWARMIVAFVIMLIYYVIRNPKIIKKIFLNPTKKLLLAGVLLSCNYYGYMRGIELTTASNAQIMIQIGPLTLLFIGVFFFNESLKLAQWSGIFIAALGFVFFNWDQVIVALEHSDVYIAGNIWILFAALSWGIFAALQKQVLMTDAKNWSPQMINLLIYGICTLTLLPFTDLETLAPLNLWQWFVLFLLGLNTLVAYGAFSEALNLIPASNVSLVITLNPLLTILFVNLITYFKLDFIKAEPIQWRGFLGAILVVVGVGLAVSLRSKNKASP